MRVAPLTELDLKRWLEAYGRAWESRNAEQAAALFTTDATYRETPFAEPFAGRAAIREYWTRVTADQADIDFQFEAITMNGATGIAQWSARFRSIANNTPVELNGIFVLELASPTEVRSLREWWHAR
jgi:hypothetical protein